MAQPLPVLLCLLLFQTATPAPGAVRRMSVSGQSAGGSMAVQHLVAYSSLVDGAGIAAGSPYGCGALPDRQERCYFGPADVADCIAYVWWRFSQGQIDNPRNLRRTPVLLFNGRNDEEVYTQVMRDTKRQLEAFVDGQWLATQFHTGATHVWSLDHGSCRCGACEAGSGSLECCDVNNCRYDLSGELLRRTYGPLASRVPARQALQAVDQWSFMPSRGAWHSSGLQRWGLVYVPTGCWGALGSCRVHVNYHGCISRDWSRRMLWATSLDLNEYGEANDIILVYPQAAGDEATGEGCWNWAFTKDDPLFDARGSVQLETVVRLVQGLEDAIAAGSRAELGNPPPQWLASPLANRSTATPSQPRVALPAVPGHHRRKPSQEASSSSPSPLRNQTGRAPKLLTSLDTIFL